MKKCDACGGSGKDSLGMTCATCMGSGSAETEEQTATARKAQDDQNWADMNQAMGKVHVEGEAEDDTADVPEPDPWDRPGADLDSKFAPKPEGKPDGKAAPKAANVQAKANPKAVPKQEPRPSAKVGTAEAAGKAEAQRRIREAEARRQQRAVQRRTAAPESVSSAVQKPAKPTVRVAPAPAPKLSQKPKVPEPAGSPAGVKVAPEPVGSPAGVKVAPEPAGSPAGAKAVPKVTGSSGEPSKEVLSWGGENCPFMNARCEGVSCRLWIKDSGCGFQFAIELLAMRLGRS